MIHLDGMKTHCWVPGPVWYLFQLFNFKDMPFTSERLHKYRICMQCTLVSVAEYTNSGFNPKVLLSSVNWYDFYCDSPDHGEPRVAKSTLLAIPRNPHMLEQEKSHPVCLKWNNFKKSSENWKCLHHPRQMISLWRQKGELLQEFPW